jgi:PAS domain S-box-containing protein
MAAKNELEKRIAELEEGQTKAEILYEIGRDLNTSRDEQELLQLLDHPARKAGASSTNLLYIDLDAAGQPEWAEVVAFWYQNGASPVEVGTRYYLPEFSFTTLFLSSPDEPLLIPDAKADKTIDKNTQILMAQLKMRATAVIPLTQRFHSEDSGPDSAPTSGTRRWVGLIIFNWDEPHQFSQQEKEIYNSLIGLASPAVENRRLVNNLEQIVKERTSEIAIFRALAENATDAIFMASLDTKINYANLSAYKMFCYDHERQELIGMKIMDLTTEEGMEFVAQEVIPTVKKTGNWQGELKRKRKDGSVFDTYITTFIVHDEAGQPIAQAAIVRDITEQKEAEAERERLQQEVIDAQKQAIQELSTPVIPIMEQIIVMPLIGSIDTMRARDITRSLLAGISTHRAKVVILDVTGVPIVDSGVANHLNKTIQAARLKGAQAIVTGISDAVAETIVDLGIDWSQLTTLSDLQTGLIAALGNMGIKLSKI